MTNGEIKLLQGAMAESLNIRGKIERLTKLSSEIYYQRHKPSSIEIFYPDNTKIYISTANLPDGDIELFASSIYDMINVSRNKLEKQLESVSVENLLLKIKGKYNDE